MAFHLLRTQLLAADLAANRVSERDGLKYMIVGALLYVHGNYFALWFGTYRDWVFFLELLLILVTSTVGVHECYKANGGDSGANFLLRFSALAVPVGVTIALVGHALGQVIYWSAPTVLGRGAFREPEVVYRYIAFIMPVSLTAAYYWQIARHLSIVKALQNVQVKSAA